MDYLEKFESLIEIKDELGFMKLWDEYCINDEVNGPELIKILKVLKTSESYRIIEKIENSLLLLSEEVSSEVEHGDLVRAIIDSQVSNSQIMHGLALQYITQKYRDDSNFTDFLKIVGLNGRDSFVGAVSNYELLRHMKIGNFVFHNGGWGIGEIMNVSFSTMNISIEFEGVGSQKDLLFDVAFKVLIPISSDHFLARRFGYPDDLEAESKKDPLKIIKLLLKDLGQQSAQDIKNNMYELVIPGDDWNKWWMSAKNKMKKDSYIIIPSDPKGVFKLSDGEISHISILKNAINSLRRTSQEVLSVVHGFIRDHAADVRVVDNKNYIVGFLEEIIQDVDSSESIKVQGISILSELGVGAHKRGLEEQIKAHEDILKLIDSIGILAIKKHVLEIVLAHRVDFEIIFLSVLFYTNFPTIREFTLKHLRESSKKDVLVAKLLHLASFPTVNPELFIWFIQKLCAKEDGVFDIEDMSVRRAFLEGALILMHNIASKNELRPLSKRIYQFLVGDKFLVIRNLLVGASVEFINEFLLLVSKCPQFDGDDKTILKGVSEAAQPLIKNKNEVVEEDVLWATTESLQKAQEKLRILSGPEMLENAKEIEEARALGDLRENSEYKFALEKRARIQLNIKDLSQQISRARIISKEDVHKNKVGIGSVISINEHGVQSTYTILGHWEANPDKNILSINSKLAQAMKNKKVGDVVSFQDRSIEIMRIDGFMD